MIDPSMAQAQQAVLQVVGGLFMTGIVGLAIWTFVGIWRHED